MTALNGIIAAVATPVKKDLSVDLDRLLQHCSRILENGCNGINLLGTTGEATSFSVDQRLSIMRAVSTSGLDVSRFMVGTGAAAFSDAVTLSSEAITMGFAGVLVLPPFYYKGIDAEGLTGYFDALIERVGSSDLNMYLYHFPANSGVPFTLDVVRRLRERYVDCIVGLKDSSGDLDYSGQLARQLPGFAVFPSAESSLARARDLGFAGCISATANVTAPFAQAAWSGSGTDRENGLEAAVKIRHAIAQFPLVPSVKAAIGLVNGDPGWQQTMPPLTALPDEAVKALSEALSLTPLGEGIRCPAV